MTRPTVAERARFAVERFSLRNLTWALGAAVLLAGLSAVVALRAPAEYRSTAVLLIDNPVSLAASGDGGTVDKLEKLRGKYATLANTEAIAGPVAERIGIRAGEVIARTDVEPVIATLSLLVTARGDEPAATRQLADAMAVGVSEFVADEHEQNDIPSADRFVIDVVRDASPAVKTSPSTDRALVSAGVVFLVVLAAAYLGLQFVRPPVPPGGRLPRGDEVDPPVGPGGTTTAAS